jgi:hypothetical protein
MRVFTVVRASVGIVMHPERESGIPYGKRPPQNSLNLYFSWKKAFSNLSSRSLHNRDLNTVIHTLK